MSDCDHAVGTAEVEYHREILHVNDSAETVGEFEFSAFSFCPYCGNSVSEAASLRAKLIQSKLDSIEMLRARSRKSLDSK